VSLINDALKDLEIRDSLLANAHGGDSIAKPLVVTAPGQRRMPTILLGVLSIAFAFYFVGQQRNSQAPPPPMEHEPDSEVVRAFVGDIGGSPDVLIRQAVIEAPLSVLQQEETSANEGPAADEGKGAPSAPTMEDEIAVQLAKAENAIRLNRLSLPPGDNALFFIKEILERNSQHNKANRLLERVVDSYLTQIDSSIETRNFMRTEALLERAEIFGISVDQIDVVQNRLDAARSATAARPDRSIGRYEYNKSTSVIHEGSRITATFDSYDMQQRDRARTMIRGGRISDGESELAAFIEKYPAALHSLIFLFDRYMSSSRSADAQVLVTSATPDHEAAAYLNARLLGFYHGPEKAIMLLERSVPSAKIKDIQMSYQTRRYGQAKKIYEALLKRNPTEDKYLLGLAISVDGLGETDRALVAYRSVLISREVSSRVLTFVRSRIKQLAGDRAFGAEL